MELKEFIQKILNDLVAAVEETRGVSPRDMYLSDNKDNRTVEFDIAVTAEDNVAASGKAGVRVLHFIEGGGDMNRETKNSTVSRIKFGVCIENSTKAELEEHNRRAGDDYI